MRSRCLPSWMALFSCLLVSSCTTWSPTVQKADGEVDHLVQKTDDMREKAKMPLTPLDMSSIQINEGFYVGSVSHKKSDGNLLPVEVEQGGVTLVSAQPTNIQQIAQLVTDATNIPVTVSDDIGSAKSNNTHESSSMHQGNTMRVDYSGPLSKFLDHVSGYYNLGWSYSGGTIHFFKNATRTYSIAALPTTITSNAKLTAGASSSGGGAGASTTGAGSMNAAVATTLDFWKDFQASVGTIVGATGTYLVNKTAGTVTVTAPYDVLDDVEDYITYVNKVLLRQVVIRVEVYALTLTAESVFSFKPTAIWSDQNGTFGFFGDSFGLTMQPGHPIAGPTSQGSSDSSGGGLPIPLSGLAGEVVGAGSGVLGGVTNGRWKGTSGLLNLADGDNKATLVTSASLTTMSGQPVPLQVGTSQDYVSKVETTLSGLSGGSQTSVTTSTVTSGIALNLLPKVMDDGKVLLQFTVNLSDPPVLQDYSTGGQQATKLQLLTLNQKSFIQQALINNGSTLILAGFENITGKDDKAGVGKSSFALLGGQYQLKKERIITVIALTPVVLDNGETAARMQQTKA